MEQVTTRNSRTSRGMQTLTPWNDYNYTYSILMINLGNNFITRLEIVSTLNSFNFACDQFFYGNGSCYEKYNPKLYFGTIQSIATEWNFDRQAGQKNGLPNLVPGGQKSGSLTICILDINNI